MNRNLFFSLLVLVYAGQGAYAYDNVGAHREFNRVMTERFLATAPTRKPLTNLIFNFKQGRLTGPAVAAGGRFSVNQIDKAYTPMEWIVEGGWSADEPNAPAAYRHFYDPLKLEKVHHLTDLPLVSQLKRNPQIDAILWHFDGSDGPDKNPWTWNNGKRAFAQALRTSDPKGRDRLMAQVYRCLGETLHNTADMGCPPHVRNDAHGGFGLGGDDAYEAGFDPKWIATYGGSRPDPDLADVFGTVKLGTEINRALAEFTNRSFFSSDTISGKGLKEVLPSNGKRAYPAPKLEKLTYKARTGDYVFTFKSGRQVSLANDLTGGSRGVPRITPASVLSQATELTPNIVTAGASLMELYFPTLRLSVKHDAGRQQLTGSFVHTTTAEYPNRVVPEGAVGFLVNNGMRRETASLSAGSFGLRVPDLKPGDKVKAFFLLGGLMWTSDEMMIGGGPGIVFESAKLVFSLNFPGQVKIGDRTVSRNETYALDRTVVLRPAKDGFFGLWGDLIQGVRMDGSVTIQTISKDLVVLRLEETRRTDKMDFRFEWVTKPIACKQSGSPYEKDYFRVDLSNLGAATEKISLSYTARLSSGPAFFKSSGMPTGLHGITLKRK